MRPFFDYATALKKRLRDCCGCYFVKHGKAGPEPERVKLINRDLEGECENGADEEAPEGRMAEDLAPVR